MLTGCASSRRPPPGVISRVPVLVVDSERKPVPGRTVHLLREPGFLVIAMHGIVASEVTDRYGRAEFVLKPTKLCRYLHRLPPSELRVAVWRTGRVPNVPANSQNCVIRPVRKFGWEIVVRMPRGA